MQRTSLGLGLKGLGHSLEIVALTASVELPDTVRWSSITSERLTFTRRSSELMIQTSEKRKTTWYVHMHVSSMSLELDICL